MNDMFRISRWLIVMAIVVIINILVLPRSPYQSSAIGIAILGQADREVAPMDPLTIPACAVPGARGVVWKLRTSTTKLQGLTNIDAHYVMMRPRAVGILFPTSVHYELRCVGRDQALVSNTALRHELANLLSSAGSDDRRLDIAVNILNTSVDSMSIVNWKGVVLNIVFIAAYILMLVVIFAIFLSR